MKRYERFLFQTDDQSPASCVAWLERLDITPTESEVERRRGSKVWYCTVNVRLPFGDDRARRLLEAIPKHTPGTSFTHREEIDYSKADYLAAPACELAATRDQKIKTGSIYGTEYDWSKACLECGIGRRQIGPLVAKRSQFPKGRPVVISEYYDILVNQRLRDELVLKVPGAAACLGSVVEHGTREPIDYWQVRPGFTLPPLHPSTVGMITDDTPETQRCKTCKRNGYFNDNNRAFQPVSHMSEEDVSRIPPFAETWEHWEFSHINVPYVDAPVVAAASLIVRRDVVVVLLDLKVRGISLTPIRFLKDVHGLGERT